MKQVHGLPLSFFESTALRRHQAKQSYFTLVFRRETGLTPGQYRAKNRR